MSSNTHSNLQQARRTVKQLRAEAAVKRIKVSKACSDLMTYCCTEGRKDPLLTGIPDSINPFKDKRPCNIL